MLHQRTVYILVCYFICMHIRFAQLVGFTFQKVQSIHITPLSNSLKANKVLVESKTLHCPNDKGWNIVLNYS